MWSIQEDKIERGESEVDTFLSVHPTKRSKKPPSHHLLHQNASANEATTSTSTFQPRRFRTVMLTMTGCRRRKEQNETCDLSLHAISFEFWVQLVVPTSQRTLPKNPTNQRRRCANDSLYDVLYRSN